MKIDMGLILALLVLNGIISAIIANVAKNREIGSINVFWISFLLTPILGMFVAAMSRQLNKEEIELSIQQSENEANMWAKGVLIVLLILCFCVS